MNYPSVKRNRVSRTSFALVIFSLITSLACGLLSTSTTTSTPSILIPTAAPAPSATPQVPMPPALVETDPINGSVVGLKDGITFYFNQPMEHSSVEGAIELQPSVGGRFSWKDDLTVSYLPDQALPPGIDLQATLKTTAHSTNGLALLNPVELSFHTAGPLQVTERIPAPYDRDIDPSSAIVIAFNNPVIPLGGETSRTKPAFRLSPAATGKGEWINTSTYIFYPEPALLGGTNYSLEIIPDLVSNQDAPLSTEPGQSFKWGFTTSNPKIITFQPDGKSLLLLDGKFILTFNQPMDTASVETYLALQSAQGNPLSGKLTWNKNSTEATFTPSSLLARNTAYTLSLSAQARSLGGTVLGEDFVANYQTVPDFAFINTNLPSSNLLETYNGFAGLTLNFSAPLAKQNFNDLVKLDPPNSSISFYPSGDDSSLGMSGFFNPGADYTIRFSPDLRDRWGGTLGSQVTYKFKSGNTHPSLTIPMLQTGSQALFVPLDETSLAAQATNLSTIKISSASETLEDFILISEAARNQSPDLSNLKFSSWSQTLNLAKNVNQPVEITLNQQKSPLPPGLYTYQLEAPELNQKGSFQLPPFQLVASRTNLLLKKSSNQMLVWAVDLDSDSPLANKPVTLFDGTAHSLDTAVTNDKGLATLQVPQSQNQFSHYYVTLGQPGDPDFGLSIDDWSNGIAGWDYGLPVNTNGDQPMAYIYSDRPIYRPGQTVNFRAILRNTDNGRYSGIDLKQVTIKVLGEFSQVLEDRPVLSTLTLPVSSYGTVAGAYTLSAGAPPGYYSLQIQEVKGSNLDFQVAEYRKPQIDLQVKFSQANQLAGQDLNASISSLYYFGAPAGNLSLHWTLYAAPQYFYIPNGYQTGKIDTNWLLPPEAFMGMGDSLGKFIIEGDDKTAPDGTLNLTIKAADIKELLDPQVFQKLTLELNTQDQNELPLSARDSMLVHPADFYIGVHPGSWSIQAGDQAGFDILTVDHQQNPSGAHPLTAIFQKVDWKEKDYIDPATGSPAIQPVYTQVATTDFQTDGNGKARLAFTAPDPGNYQLDISGQGAITQVMLWVGGKGTAAWPDLPNQHIQLTADAQKYRPGDTAQVFIPNPFGDNTLALVTIERSRVMKSEVLALNGANYKYSLPLDDTDAPNIYLSVSLLGHRPDGSLDFRQGYLQIAVEPLAEKLKVELSSSPQSSQPGGEVHYSINVTDVNNKPVQGEFSFGLVDKAVLALADPNSPDILDAFYGAQPLGVMNSLTLAAYAHRIPLMALGRGGGGGQGILPPGVRIQFPDTAYWDPVIQTDSNGSAQLDLKLPDNLTTWVADVRGITLDSRVGSATSSLITSKDLAIIPTTPRFLVVGDHVQLAANVHNNTDKPLSVQVSLQSTGFVLDDPAKISQQVSVAARDQAHVTWWGTAQEIDQADLIFAAQSGDLQDSSRPDQGKLPVLHYSSPQTFGTSGILTQGGEKVEAIGLPRSFKPTGGELRLELSPSLAASIVDSLKVLENPPADLTEPILSRLLPNLETYLALKDLGLESPNLKSQLENAINDSIDRLSRSQKKDGSWGWAPAGDSDSYISAYVLFGLGRAVQAGIFVDAKAIQKAQEYIASELSAPEKSMPSWQLDRMEFNYFALQQSNYPNVDVARLYDFKDQLDPFATAMLAISMHGVNPQDERVATLLANLKGSGIQSATGINWQDATPSQLNLSTLNFNTALVTLALARLDPASPLLTDATRYLVANRKASGGWASSYESAWVLMALTEAFKGTGDLQADFAFSASLNGTPLASGKAGGPNALTPVTASIPLNELNSDTSNLLRINRQDGNGRLYYRAFLQVNRPVESAPPVERGLSVSRSYYRADQDCRGSDCQPVSSIQMGNTRPLILARVTLNLPSDMYYLVVEDAIPAGAEILNTNLKTSQQGTPDVKGRVFDPSDPFSSGWGWWLFNSPQIFDQKIRWTAPYLPAGTYQLTYKLVPLISGEYRLLPAHAYQYYFPDVEGSSAGSVFKIQP